MGERMAGHGVESPRIRLGAAIDSWVPGPSHPAPSMELGDSLKLPEPGRVPNSKADCRAISTCPQKRRRRPRRGKPLLGEDPQTPQAEKKAGENPKARVWSKGESQPYPREKGMEAWPGYAGPGTKLERTPEDEGGGLGSAPPSQESTRPYPARP